jgi:cation:H+ antiporter
MRSSLAVLVFLGGLAVTIPSSLVLARALDRIGERFGFSEALLGIVTAVGADAPEISSAVAALVTGHEDTGVGVVVGSNVFNIAALLGVSAVIAGPVRIHKHGLALTGGVAVAAALVGALLVLGWIPSGVAFGVALLVLTPYVVLSSLHSAARARLPGPLREAVQEEQRDARRDEHAGRGTAFDAMLLVPALTGVVGGAAAMVAGAQSLGDHWGVADVVIGTLVLAGLTGIPNVLAAIRLALHGRGAACVSESLNSNNANLLIGLCVPALVLGIGDASGIEIFAAWSMVAITALAVTFAFRGGGLSRMEGAAIIALYCGFVVTVVAR